jgi:Ni,Fe-hydrogenase I cytochrome b subunit
VRLEFQSGFITGRCASALCVTGYLIGNPWRSVSSAYQQYWFGWVVIHFVTAFVFFFNLRESAEVCGNSYALDQLHSVQKAQFQEMVMAWTLKQRS